MKFRFVFLGPDGDPDRSEGMPIVEAASAALRYEAAPGGMVRREPGSRGEARFVPLANFVARIVSDRFVSDAGKERRIINFVTVQVENRQDGAVANGIEKLADVPGCRQRAGFRLAVAHHGGNDQIGIVESGTTGVRQHVPEFTAFVYRAGCFRRAVAAYTTGKGELFEEFAQPPFIFAP